MDATTAVRSDGQSDSAWMRTEAQMAAAGDASPIGPDSDRGSIPGRFAQVVAQQGGRIAISSPGAEWTYEELNHRSGRLAWQILDRREDAHDPVVLVMEHGAPVVASILGTLRAGKIYLALDPTFPPRRLAAMVVDSGSRLLISDQANLALARVLCPENGQVLEVSPEAAGPETSARLPEVGSDAGAWLMYTSGSTGEPKGVWQDHAGARHHSDVYRDLARLTPDDRLSLLTPLSLAASATHLFAALLNGATLCPFSARSQGIKRLAAWLGERRITMCHSVPTVFRQLAQLAGNRDSFQTLRIVRLGGEPAMLPEVEWFRRRCPGACRLMHALSSTETGLVTAFMMEPTTPPPPGRLPAGKPVPGVEGDSGGRRAAAGERRRGGPHPRPERVSCARLLAAA